MGHVQKHGSIELFTNILPRSPLFHYDEQASTSETTQLSQVEEDTKSSEEDREIELLPVQLNEKNAKIAQLHHLLDNMTTIKTENEKLKNEIVKIQKMAENERGDHEQAMKEYERENDALKNKNNQLALQLQDNTGTGINEEIEYLDLKHFHFGSFGRRSRRNSTASYVSDGSTLQSIPFWADHDHEMDIDMD